MAEQTTYTIKARLGQGGMGEVYRALQLPLGREVAIKFVLDSLEEPERLERFRREVQAAIRFSHPGIIKIFDHGQIGDRYFYAMELAEDGTCLKTLLEDSGPLELEKSLSIALQILDALDACHAAGLIHRDVKPGNILVNSAGRAILMDFGLVRDTHATMLTRPGSVLATPTYAPPEAFTDAVPAPGIDIWAVGVVLHEMLSGHRAFRGETLEQVVTAIREDDPVPILHWRPELPASLEETVMQFLKKDPKRRVASARAGKALLENWLETLRAGPRRRTTSRRDPAPAFTEPGTLHVAGLRARLIAAVLIGVVMVCVPLLWFRTRRPEPPAPAVVWLNDGLSKGQDGAAASPGAAPSDVELADLVARVRMRLGRYQPVQRTRDLLDKLRGTQRAKTMADRQRLVNALAPQVGARIAEDLRAIHLAEAIDELAGHLDRAYRSPEIPAESKLELYALTQDLVDFEALTDRCGIVSARLAGKLQSEAYGAVATPRLARPAGAALVLEPSLALFEKHGPSGARVRAVTTEQDHTRLRARTDIRLGPVEALGQHGDPFHVHAQPLWQSGRPSASGAELRALVSTGGRCDGLRVLMSTENVPERRRWRLLAHLRPPDANLQVLCHAIPPGILPAAPAYLRLEVAHSGAREVLEGHVTQDILLHWVMLGTE